MSDDFNMNIQYEELYDDEYGFEWSDRFEEALGYEED